MKRISNKKGFTLVELLAVIIVLAIIIVIAVPGILNSANNAKQKAFQIEAQKLFRDVMAHYESEKLLGTPNLHNFTHTVDGSSVIEKCYNFKDFGVEPAGFQGFIIINPSISVVNGVSQTEYKIYLTNQTYSYVGASYDDVYENKSGVLKNDQASVDAVVAAKCVS